MRAFTFFDLAFLASTVGPTVVTAVDDFDSYTAGGSINGENGGTNWVLPFVGLGCTYMGDYFTSYSDNDDLNGLNGGETISDWTGAWISHNFEMPFDDFQSYSNGNALDGLNGGDYWPGAYVSHTT